MIDRFRTNMLAVFGLGIIIVLLLVAVLIVLSGSAAAPFIYTLF